MTDIESYLPEKKMLIDQELMACLPRPGSSRVGDAMRYSVGAGGKRLRPILALATAETLGAGEESVITVACSLELIHTYSLIHDDLPAMDNSDLRRGQPACHIAFGESTAILAGDALLTLAFEQVATWGLKNETATQAVIITRELARAAGIYGMIGGQELDLAAEGMSLTLPEIERIAALKTGALITASVCCGALAACPSAEELAVLKRFAQKAGLAFQIVDDLLDREGNAGEVGKPVRADEGMAKATFPALLGTEIARNQAITLYTEAIKLLEKLERNTQLLSALAHKLVYRKN